MTTGPGRFIVLEGGEGTGKTTQVAECADRLRSLGRTVVTTFEPGGTTVGKAIRTLLLDARSEIDPWTEAMLYAADRAQHVREVVVPALEAGADVLSDRFLWSSLAYQGAGRGLGVEAVEELNAPAVAPLGGPPDLVIVLDADPLVGLVRASREGADRIESESVAFHQRVREAFLALARERRGAVVDAGNSVADVTAAVWDLVYPEDPV